MSDAPSGWLVDWHGASALYAGSAALAGIGERANDLLWSELPALRCVVDLGLGYGLAALLFGTHLGLRFGWRHALPAASAGMALLAAVCASQLLAAALALPAYVLYEGDSAITLLVSAGVLAGLLRCYKVSANARPSSSNTS